MLQSKQRLLQLNAKLAETLTSKGVEATADETTTALVNKVGDLKIGDNRDLISVIDGSITDLIIPDGTNSIGPYALYSQVNLISVKLSENVLTVGVRAFQDCSKLKVVNINSNLKKIDYRAFIYCRKLTKINFPKSLSDVNNDALLFCENLSDVTLEDGFNCNGLNLSASTLYSSETIISWLNALADRTGQTAYKLTIGATNLAKLTEEDILIATNKNWTLA